MAMYAHVPLGTSHGLDNNGIGNHQWTTPLLASLSLVALGVCLSTALRPTSHLAGAISYPVVDAASASMIPALRPAATRVPLAPKGTSEHFTEGNLQSEDVYVPKITRAIREADYSSQQPAGFLVSFGLLCLAAAAAICMAYLRRQQHIHTQLPSVQFMDIWHAAATVGDDDGSAVDDQATEDDSDDYQDGDSPSGGYSNDEAEMDDDVVDDPITSSMSASDQVRLAVINEVRRQFHRTVAPLERQGEPKSSLGDAELTRTALFMTRMMRVIGQKSADLVELKDLPSDTLTPEQSLEYFLLPSSTKLRALLANETSRAADLFFRLNVIGARNELKQAVPQLATINSMQLPFLLPVQSGLPRPVLLKPDVLLDAIAPELTADEQAYAYALEQLANEVYGIELANFLSGKSAKDPTALLQRVISSVNAAVSAGMMEMGSLLQAEFLDNLRKRVKESDAGELAIAVQSLDDIDRKTLQTWANDVLEKGWQTLLRRIAYLSE